MNDTPKLPSEVLTIRYRDYSIELMAEALTNFAKVMRQPEAPKGFLINTLEHLIAALREEPYTVVTEYDRKLHLHSRELLNTAFASLNGSDTTEGRAKLYTLVEELRRQ